MEMSITSETISQQTICGDKGGLNAGVENNKELIKLEQMQNNLSREIYFKYFSSLKMARTKATVRKLAMRGLPLVSSIRGKTSIKIGKSGKGKTP